MGKGKGTDHGLYVSDTAPAGGSEGDITEYDLVGFGKDLGYSIDRDMIETSDKDTGSDSTYVGGRRTQEITQTVNGDKTDGGDAGQETILDKINDTAGDVVYFLITDNVSGNKEWYGQAIPSAAEWSFPDEELVELDLTLQITGGVTVQAST